MPKLRITYFAKTRETFNISDAEAKKIESLADNNDDKNAVENYIDSEYKGYFCKKMR